MRTFVIFGILVLLGLVFTSTASAAPASDWSVVYYNDPDQCSSNWPNCNPNQVLCTRSVSGTGFSINYADGNPCTGVNDQTWGSKWTQVVNFPAGDYVFRSNHDDGLKVFVGDKNIVDVGGVENNAQACPAIHLDGNVTLTLVHTNVGGPAYLNLWWDTNTATCNTPPQGKMNLWVWRDASSQTYVTNEAGDKPPVRLVYWDREESGGDLWQPAEGGRTVLRIEEYVLSFLVERDSNVVIGSNDWPEWYLGTDGHWVIRRLLKISVANGQTYLRYTHTDVRPTIRYWRVSDGQMVDTNSLWNRSGEDMVATIPSEAKSFVVLLWIRPRVDASSDPYWSVNRGTFVVTKTRDIPQPLTRHLYLPSIRR